MKKFIAMFMLLALGMSTTIAQKEVLKPEVAYPVYFDVSPPLRDMVKYAPAKADNSWKDGIVKNKFDINQGPEQKSAIPDFMNPITQDYIGSVATDTTLQNFDGVNNVSGYNPPDTHGDVGPNHYFQVVNCSYAIYNKTGTKLLGPTGNSSVWNGMPNNSNDGDAVVLYDEVADRWLFTQFSLPHYPNGPYFQMIAVSTTPDPTGSWYRYEYQYTEMPDYPKFGIWPDGYYMGCNRFANGSSFAGTGADAFDRAAMLAGTPTAARISFTLPSSNEAFTAIPADCDGAFPPMGTPEYFTYIRNQGPRHLGIIEFHADWTTPANSTFGTSLNITVPTYSFTITGGIPQKGTSVKVPAIMDRLMYRVQYRTFNGYNAMVMNHTINVGSNTAGIRWYELRNSDTAAWSLYQQSTYAPADGNSRWMGSIAMDSVGNIALGYSISSANMYPSIRYTGRMSCDSLNVMTIAEKGIMNGGGSSTAAPADYCRWGDYSAMSCDPSQNGKFWYTQEYYASTSQSNWRTRIASFTFFTANAFATPQTVCAGDSSQLNALASCGVSGNYTYQWSSIPAGFTSTQQSPKVAPLTPTQYVVELSDGTSTRTDTILVDVKPAPAVSAGADTTVCWYVTSVNVNGTVNNYSGINWTTSGTGTFANPTSSSTTYAPTLEDKIAGSVDLIFTATPVAPCTQSVASTKHVIFDVCTGIDGKKNAEPSLAIQPNPAHGTVLFAIGGISSGSYSLSITSTDGKTLYSEAFEASALPALKTMNISAYPRGIYFVQLKTGQKIITEKMIVQ